MVKPQTRLQETWLRLLRGGGVGINRKSGCLGQSALTQPKERGRELNKLSKFVVFCFVNEFGYKTVKS